MKDWVAGKVYRGFSQKLMRKDSIQLINQSSTISSQEQRETLEKSKQSTQIEIEVND